MSAEADTLIDAKRGIVSKRRCSHHGSRVLIRPIRYEDTSAIVRWRNEPSVRSNLLSQDEITSDGHIAWLNSAVKTGKCDQFIIEVIDSGVPVGSTFLKAIDREKREAEFGIFIGKEGRGKGYASEVTALALEHGFGCLDLDSIYLTVFSDNEPGIKAYERVGFLHDASADYIVDVANGRRTLLTMRIEKPESFSK